jgi:acetyl esterase/lipase
METMNLWADGKQPIPSKDGFTPYLELHPVKTDKPRGAVLVCPGGGYTKRADHEGHLIAECFNKAGIHAFVLHYRVAPNRHPAPLSDARRGIRIIRANAGDWKVNPGKIAICGFSAGGHLAASLGVHYGLEDSSPGDDIDKQPARPDALILSYAVLVANKFKHPGSFDNLLGKGHARELRELMSLERHVDKNTPPAFLWHTAEDPAVPVENSLIFAVRLSKFNVPFELHVYEKGKHGMGLGTEDERVATWSVLCTGWLKKNLGWLD